MIVPGASPLAGSFTTTLSYEEYLAANQLMMRRRWWMRGFLRFTLAVGLVYWGIGVAVVLFDAGTIDAPTVLYALLIALGLATAVALGLMLVGRWRLPRTCRKMWAQQHIEGLATTHEFDNAGIRIANARGSSDLEWSMFSGWIEDERLLMMFRTPLVFHAVPKAQVTATQLAAVRERLEAAGVPPRC